MRPLSAVAILIAAGAAAAGRDRVPEATAAGPAVNCVYLSAIRETRVRDDRTIDFVMHNGKVYRNVLPNECASLGFEARFGYATSLNELCSVDVITVLRGSDLGPGPSCGLGQFQPVTLAKR